MNNFNGGQNRSFGKKPYGNRDRGDRQMYSAVCSSCGKDCQVPFQPTGDKPVYCSDCFEKVRGNRNEAPRNDRSFGDRPSYRPAPSFRAPAADQNKLQFDALNAKVDKILSLLQPKVEYKVEPAETLTETPAKTEVAEIKTPKVSKTAKKTASKKKK